jgi:hypothetical protein
MIFRILEKFMAALAAFFVLINREQDRASGRQQEQAKGQTEIINRMQNAQNIRGADALPDDLLLPPAKRSAGGVQSLPANLLISARGGADKGAASSNANKAAQQNMGEQLFKIKFQKPQRWVNKVFIHCSDSDYAQHDNVEIIKAWHLKRGFNDIGYHYFINKMGVVFDGRDLEKSPAAQEGHNTGSIAICLSGRKNFTEAQFVNLCDLCAQIKVAIPFVSIHGHCEVNPRKTCPNFDYKKVLGL